jgi:DNA-binding transcriptional regulator YbjK
VTSEHSGGARNARGTRRRQLLVGAAAELLLEEGFAALSHRAVAARASLPLASTTYYFTSGDDLRDAAVQHLAEEWSARAVGVVAVLPTGVDGGQAAEAIARLVGADATPQQLLLLYERYLEAGRQHGRYRPRRGNRPRTHTERRR